MPGSDGRIKGPSDERAQARERLRRRLLDAARALATEQGGYDAVTVRAVASRVGYAAPVVYQYFSNKHDLLVAVVDTGFAELAERLGRAQCRNKTDMLLATAEEYWAFAMAEPYLYRLMHGLGGVPFGEPNTPKSALDCFHLLAAAAGPAHRAGIRTRSPTCSGPNSTAWSPSHSTVESKGVPPAPSGYSPILSPPTPDARLRSSDQHGRPTSAHPPWTCQVSRAAAEASRPSSHARRPTTCQPSRPPGGPAREPNRTRGVGIPMIHFGALTWARQRLRDISRSPGAIQSQQKQQGPRPD
ncbi:TetR family transcriptional regulator [Actinomadura madurae]|uniref:TetR/AcrR family transcriptional regulator n=1 Tax=Actinomadura madurae TaxID=1993 RepID=UPI003D6B5B84